MPRHGEQRGRATPPKLISGMLRVEEFGWGMTILSCQCHIMASRSDEEIIKTRSEPNRPGADIDWGNDFWEDLAIWPCKWPCRSNIIIKT